MGKINAPPQSTPHGRALAYVGLRDGISNIWRLPLDGTPATPITHFDSGQTLLHFAFSRDGKQLAMVRGWKTSDIVLIDQ
jgi:Tol biopolymer transport system component